MIKKAVLAGSFDPVNTGHIDLIRRALTVFDELYVIVAVNTQKNCMFTLDERVEMMRAAVAENGFDRVICEKCDTPIFEYCIKVGAIAVVKGARSGSDFDYERTLHLQSASLIDGIETVVFPTRTEFEYISSTFARNLLTFGYSTEGVIPTAAMKYITEKTKGKAKE